jgi:hypothetical protein
MFVWSKRLVTALLVIFAISAGFLFVSGSSAAGEGPPSFLGRWMAVNYLGLAIWIFVWMIDQARVRGKNIWLWLIPFVLLPLPTLMVFILFLQRRMR